jgi:peptidyl-prolyl cis-trans isomerase-like 3
MLLMQANSGPNTNRSQFYISYKAQPSLNGKYSVFGHVIDGLDTLDRLEKLPGDANDRPRQEIKVGERYVSAACSLCTLSTLPTLL